MNKGHARCERRAHNSKAWSILLLAFLLEYILSPQKKYYLWIAQKCPHPKK
jgi:hypothetical protein